MENPAPIQVGFAVDIQEADALDFPADVLMVKDWRNMSRGLDSIVYRRITDKGIQLPLLDDNEYHFLKSENVAVVDFILLVGPTRRRIGNYTHIREIAFDMLRFLKEAHPTAEHVITNVQGANIGYDEAESLRSMLLGFNDAYEKSEYPPTLKRISFVEKNPNRAELLRYHLEKILPQTTIVEAVDETKEEIANILSGQDSFAVEEQRPEATDKTPHVFVAMPFDERYDDQYYLAIRPAVEDANLLCVRLDQLENAFTGNIVEQIKERINSATLVIGLLDSANPNVYLEVGYAWGRGIPTVLIINQNETEADVPFDVRGERLIIYRHIYKLKNDLVNELKALARKR